MPTSLSSFIDRAFLQPRRVQNLRMIYSVKDDDPNRQKKFYAEGVPRNELLFQPRDSFVQYVPAITLPDLPLDPRVSQISTHMNGTTIVQEAYDVLVQWCKDNYFRIGEPINVGIVDLVRIGPSMCDVCERTHEHRGAYALISKRLLQIRCRRADDENLQGTTHIWRCVDYRDDFTDPCGNWNLMDEGKLPVRLVDSTDIARFRKFVHQNIAYLRCGGTEPFFVLRTFNSDFSVDFQFSRTLRGRGKSYIISVGGKEKQLSFEKVVEHFVLEEICYSKIDFVPYFGDDEPSLPPSALNLWLGYKFTREMCASIDMNLVEPLLAHFRHIWCRDEVALFEYLMNWFAYLIQKPSNPRRTALVVKGLQGCGKTSPVEYIGRRVIGSRYFYMCDIERMTARFNDDLSRKLLVLIDETYQSEMSQTSLEARLKNFITAPTINIEVKNMPIMEVRNNLHFIFCSNSELPVRIAPTERRYCVFDCLPVPADERREYFSRLFENLEKPDAPRSIFSYFAARDISRFDIEQIPNSEGLIRCKIESMERPMLFLYEVSRGTFPHWQDATAQYEEAAQDFYDAFCRWCASNNFQKIPTKRVFEMEVSRIIGPVKQIRRGDGRVYAHIFTLTEIQGAINSALGLH